MDEKKTKEKQIEHANNFLKNVDLLRTCICRLFSLPFSNPNVKDDSIQSSLKTEISYFFSAKQALEELSKNLNDQFNTNRDLVFHSEFILQNQNKIYSTYSWRESVWRNSTSSLVFLERELSKSFQFNRKSKQLHGNENFSQVATKRRKLLEENLDNFEFNDTLFQLENADSFEKFSMIDEIIEKVRSSTSLFISKVYQQKKIMGIHLKQNGVFQADILFSNELFLPNENNQKINISQISFYGFSETGGFWYRSKMNCFRKISENAFDALQYFQLHFPDQTLEKLLMWASKYQNLFSEKCALCSNILSRDSEKYSYLPPTYRSLIDGKAYHNHCKANQSKSNHPII